MKQKELIIRENIRSGRNHNDRFSIFFPVLEYRVIKKGKPNYFLWKWPLLHTPLLHSFHNQVWGVMFAYAYSNRKEHFAWEIKTDLLLHRSYGFFKNAYLERCCCGFCDRFVYVYDAVLCF